MPPARLLIALAALAPLALVSPPLAGRPRPTAVAAAAGGGGPAAWRCAAPARYPVTEAAGAESELLGIAAVAPDDIWAVGAEGITTAGQLRQLIVHWDGARWRRLTTSLATGSSRLWGVAALARNDVWGVGDRGGESPLIEHWDGRSWRMVASPPVESDGTFRDVAAAAANDVWAVGSANFGPRALVEHWDGRRWRVVGGIVGAGAGSYLESVSAASVGEVWVAGNGTTPPGTLLARWDGTRWEARPIPGIKPGAGLGSVLALSASDVWVSGGQGYNRQTYTDAQPLVAHWDGTRWRPAADAIRLGGVGAFAARASDDIWGLGTDGAHFTLMHWDGTRWSRVAVLANAPSALAVVAPGSVWAAGTSPRTIRGADTNVPELDHYQCAPATPARS